MMKYMIIYSSSPGKQAENTLKHTYPILTSVGSTSKNSPIPPKTPPSILFVCDL